MSGNDYYQLLRESENADHVLRSQQQVVNDAVIWKMPTFVLSDAEVDRLFDAVRKHKTLILDLRGNPGGTVATLDRMLGNVFDHDVKIADRVGRTDLKPEVAKTMGGHAFAGSVIVIVDSASGSAAELFCPRDSVGTSRPCFGRSELGERYGSGNIPFLSRARCGDLLCIFCDGG